MDYVLASYYAWQGEPVRRASWPKGVYVCLKGASPHLFAPKQVPTVWRYTLEDFRANDYEKVPPGLCRSNPPSESEPTGDPDGVAPEADLDDQREADDSA